MNVHDPSLALAADIAKTMLGGPVELERLRTGGRNSRIYRVRHEGRDFALKQYPSRRDDPRDRLATEVGALRLMERHGIEVVPKVVAEDRGHNFVLLSWLEGQPVTEPRDADIDAAAAFLSAVHALRGAPESREQPLAAEACLSGGEIARQVRGRIALLEGLRAKETELAGFLDREFLPTFDRLLELARKRVQAGGLSFNSELPQERRSLVPSDFGFHNSMRRDDSALLFVDFEYFGWDDPVKLTADILLHPGAQLTDAQRLRFRTAAERLYGDDTSFAPRLAGFISLFGLRWVLILLNEFVPERWQRRVLAGAAENWDEAKARQLAKARGFLARVAAAE